MSSSMIVTSCRTCEDSSLLSRVDSSSQVRKKCKIEALSLFYHYVQLRYHVRGCASLMYLIIVYLRGGEGSNEMRGGF